METDVADNEDYLYFVCLLISFAKGCHKLIYYKVRVFKLLPFSNIYYIVAQAEIWFGGCCSSTFLSQKTLNIFNYMQKLMSIAYQF